MIKFWLFVSNKGSSASFDPVFMLKIKGDERLFKINGFLW